MDRLIELAEASGAALPVDADEVIALTQYAVPFRYDDFLDSQPLDRERTVALLDRIGEWARGAV